MEGISLPIREIVGITEELARYSKDHTLMDQLTVTRGYAELVQMDPSNFTYHAKLQIALQRFPVHDEGFFVFSVFVILIAAVNVAFLCNVWIAIAGNDSTQQN